MLYLISGAFAMLAVFAWYYRRPYLQPIVYIIYGVVSLILAVYQSSNWTPIFIIRYFFMIISTVIIMVMPVFILLIILLMIYTLRQQKPLPLWNRLINILMILSLTVFLLYTLWVIINIRTIDYTYFFNLYSTIALYFTILFISYYLLIFVIHFWPQKKPSSLIVILGSEVTSEGEIPSILKERLDYAYNYYHKYSPLVDQPIQFIVTGGKASHSRLSEADYMAQYLIQKGIPAKNIIVESQAKNTNENFAFIKQIMDDMNIKQSITIITSKFHLLRAHFFAWKQLITAHFIGSSSPLLLWPYALVREYIAFIILTKEINFVFLILLLILN